MGEAKSATATGRAEGIKIGGSEVSLWAKADRIPFAFQLPVGDFELTTRLGESSPDGAEGLGGVEIRLLEKDGIPRPDDAQTYLGRRFKDAMLQMLRRPIRGADTFHRDLGPSPGELWLRVIRAGDVISIWFSKDGKTWSSPRFSAMRANGRVAVGLVAGGSKAIPASLLFESVRLEAPKFGNTTSWLGNSLPGGGPTVGHVINYGRAIWTDPANGEFFLNGEDENSSFSAWNADGTFRWFRENANFQHGSAVAADARWVYQALHRARGQNDGFMRIDRTNGQLAGGPFLVGKLILGMDILKQTLILSDSTDGVIRFWNTADMKETASMPFTRPGPLAVDRRTGELWVIRMDEAGRGKSVVKLAADGKPTGVEITSLEWPRGLAVGADGRVHVADSGRSQQVHIFDAQGRETGHLGAEGGMGSKHAGTFPGQSHPEKLNFPSAVATDDAGNVLVLRTREIINVAY